MAPQKWNLGTITNRSSLQTKLIVTFVPLLLVILICFLVYVNWFIVKPLREKTVDETMLTATKVSRQLDDYIAVQNQLSQRILSNQNLFSLMESGTLPASEGLARVRELKDMMFQALGPSLDIRDMAIYNLRGNPVASYIGMPMPASLLPVINDKEFADKLNDRKFVLYSDEQGTLAFIRSISNIDGVLYGYLYIQMDNAYLQNVASGIVGSAIYVVDPYGKEIAKSRDAKDSKDNIERMQAVTSNSGIYLDNAQNYVAYQKSESSGWTTFIVTSKASVLGSVNSIKHFAIFIISALMLLSLVYVYISSRNFVLPIRRLRSQIIRMNYSNLSLKTDDKLIFNDLSLLNNAFEDMLERLQASIEREKLAVHEEVMARNSALQAHIAPHFIHNALYLISIASQEGKSEVVSEMCQQLSESLRYIVSSPYKHVNMLEEFEHTKRYLSLVKRNYEDDLVWEIEMDPFAEAIQLPRLVIQPSVENCIEHAFSQTDPPWRIHIKIKLYNGLWAIEITDNGSGIEQEKIKEILDKIEESDHGLEELRKETLGIGSMGIVNTVNRLKLMYKNRLFFNMFNNTDGGGMTVQIIASLERDFY
ncbi:sensor histidine kinase [Gorillibacterium massiliense]|uniref:sensor histidine kinase n=1 Tax=Gorillibacterium massiliense TaxID=1280390 RepID=UPI0004BB59EF|nr:sensor histidine kinase [Gorillibacterium massiliense]